MATPSVSLFPDADTPPPILTQGRASISHTLIALGAEARLYKTTYLVPTLPCALKYRPPKTYRHPALDARLTRQRITAEARVLLRCRREGVSVPAVYAVDEAAGWMMMEWVEGEPVRKAINKWLHDHSTTGKNRKKRAGKEDEGQDATEASRDDGDKQLGGARRDDQEMQALLPLLQRMGAAVGLLHAIGTIHGDLTTSNMMLRPPQSGHGTDMPPLQGDIVLVDFGLAKQGISEEDRAVDLYVLERAFGSTHPCAEHLFASAVLENGYRASFQEAGAVLRKLEGVRQRGRKRSMLG